MLQTILEAPKEYVKKDPDKGKRRYVVTNQLSNSKKYLNGLDHVGLVRHLPIFLVGSLARGIPTGGRFFIHPVTILPSTVLIYVPVCV